MPHCVFGEFLKLGHENPERQQRWNEVSRRIFLNISLTAIALSRPCGTVFIPEIVVILVLDGGLCTLLALLEASESNRMMNLKHLMRIFSSYNGLRSDLPFLRFY